MSDISQTKKKKNDQVDKIDDRSLSVNRYRYTRTWIALFPNIIAIFRQAAWVCTCHHISTGKWERLRNEIPIT